MTGRGKTKTLNLIRTLIVLGGILALANCDNPILSQITQRTSQAISGVSPFATFSFTAALNGTAGVTLDSVGTITGADVKVTVPFGTHVTALVATFTSSSQGIVTVGATEQTSATTPNDFTNPVSYTLTGSDGTTYTGTVTVTVGPAGVILGNSVMNLAAGGQPTPLLYTISPPDPTATFTWTISDSTIVKLTNIGLIPSFGEGGGSAGLVWEELVTPLAVGTATLTLKSADGSKTATCTVTVTAPVAVAGVTLNSTSLSLAIGGNPAYMQPTVTPSNATNKFITWTSSTPGVATVDASGTVTAVSIGYTIVTATTFDGGKTATCLVNVVAPTPVSGITMNQPSGTLAVGGGTTYIQASINPTNATNQHVTWTSDNAAIASVTNYGGTYAYVTPVAVGVAHITATTADGSKTAAYTATVTAPVAVTGVSMSQSVMTLAVGGNNYLYAYLSPSNATNQNATWSSSNASVIAITNSWNSQVALQALSAGTSTITVTTDDGTKTASCVVTVTPAILVNSISMTAMTIAPNSSSSIYAQVFPSNATNQSLTWSSGTPSIVAVSNSGNATGLAVGTSLVTATATDGSGKSGTATVTVAAVNTVSIGANFTLSLSGTTYLKDATIYPSLSPLIGSFSNVPYINVAWSSSNPAVATATSQNSYANYGYIYGYSVGSALITATATDGSGKSASITVTVNP